MRLQKDRITRDREKLYFMNEADEQLRKGRNAKRSVRYGYSRGRGRLVTIHNIDRFLSIDIEA